MRLRHLALAVTDEQRSRDFYERWLGFGVAPPRRYPDGVLMLYGPGDVSLALGHAAARPTLPPFLHFSFTRAGYASVKCRDPDGYVVEAFWEPG